MFFAIFDLISRRASYRSLEVADLINVPNDEEAKVIVNELHCRTPAIVQPYGLTSGQLDEFSQVASSASDRLLRREVCFVGMWSVRKGARDWGAIARAVRAGVPDARFLFLGTMVEEATLLRDLALDDASFIALVPQYAPNELPQLLASATVGAFPSYVEGFGLGVIEQLAAGIPTVAYDIPGPRGILAPEFPEMLTPLGDIDLFAAAIVKLLKTGASEYERLSAKARARAANFRWDTIAAETVEHYAARLPRT